ERHTGKIAIRAVPRAEDEHSDNGLNSPSAPSASPDGSKNRYDGNDFRADSDFGEGPSASRPPRPPEADVTGHAADTEPKTAVRPNPLEDNKADTADGADSDFGPISEHFMEEGDGRRPPAGTTCAFSGNDPGEMPKHLIEAGERHERRGAAHD